MAVVLPLAVIVLDVPETLKKPDPFGIDRAVPLPAIEILEAVPITLILPLVVPPQNNVLVDG